MDTWYLKDARGGVVGPLSREVASDLVRSKPGLFVHGSHDGVTWKPLKATPALAEGEQPAARLQRETSAAQLVELQLDRYREMAPHHLFGVPEGSTDLKAWRQGFLNVAKRFHPGRLPKDVAPALLKAHMAMYQYLTEVMERVERTLGDQATGAERIPTPRSGTPVLWTLEALGAKRLAHAVEAALSVTPRTAFVFSVHRLINLSNHGVFFPVLPPLQLGTRMEITFRFEEAGREVHARGKVAVESTTITPAQQLRGFGVRFDGLPAEDRGFMLREVKRLEAAAQVR
ncbi:MAG: PilZ domain-containing protein [Myxococcota bacterium]